MVPATFEAVAVLLLAIAPGYVAILAWDRLRTWQGFSDQLDTVLKALTASLLIQVLMFPLAILLGLYPLHGHPAHRAGALLFWLVLTVLALPILGGLVVGFVQDRVISRVASAPTAWDRFILEKAASGSWMIVTFNDGSRLGGAWDAGSYAFTSPDPPGLFLEREWLVSPDGNLIREYPLSGGVLIRDATTIRQVRLVLPPR